VPRPDSPEGARAGDAPENWPPPYPPPYPPPGYPGPSGASPSPGTRPPGDVPATWRTRRLPPLDRASLNGASSRPPSAGPPSAGPPSAGSAARFLDVPGAPPATRSAAWFWLVMGLVGFVVGQIVATVFIAIAAALAGESGELHKFATMSAPPEWYVGTSLVGLWVGFFMGPWIASRARGTGRFLADLGVRFRLIDLVGVPIGVGAQFVLDALYSPFIEHLKNFTAPTTKLVGASHGWGYAVIAILTVCGAPFFEEVLFRGLGLKALARLFAPTTQKATRRRAAGLTAAVVVDGILFGLAHWELYQFAGLAVFGMLLALISYKTGRLGMNMVTHASFNLVAVLALVGSTGGVIH